MTNNQTSIFRSKLALPLAVFSIALGAAFFLTACGGGGGGGPGSVVTPTGIEVTTQPRTVYRAGTNFIPQGMEITISFSNGSVRTLPFAGNQNIFSIEWNGSPWVNPGDLQNMMGTTGSHILTIRHEGFTDFLEIQVVPGTASVQRVAITNPAEKRDYYINHAFDPAGMVINATFVWNVDNETFEAPFSSFMEHEFRQDWDYYIFTAATAGQAGDMSQAGTRYVEISYLRQHSENRFDITITRPEGAQRIEVSTSKKTYFTGDVFDPKSITVTAFDFDNDPTPVLWNDPALNIHISGLGNVDINNPPVFVLPGEADITISYENAPPAGLRVDVIQLVITGLSIDTHPKLTYEFGEPFSLMGLALRAEYNNSQTHIIEYAVTPSSRFTVAPEPDTRRPGQQRIMVFYDGHESYVELNIMVNDPVIPVTTGSITASASRIDYIAGQRFDPAVFTVHENLLQGGSAAGQRQIPLDQIMFSIGGNAFTSANPPILNHLGSIPVEVAYTNQEGTFRDTVYINVTAVTLESINIRHFPSRNVFEHGEELDLSDLVLFGINNDGSPYGDISYPNAGIGTMPVSVDMRQTGPQNIHFTYEGHTTSHFFTITIREPIVTTGITAAISKTSYFTGEAFDPSAVTVTVVNSRNQHTVLQSLDNVTFTMGGTHFTPASPLVFSNSNVGNNIPVEVSYTDQHGTFRDTVYINVTAVALETISIASPPERTKYPFGYEGGLDLSGLTLSGVNNSGTPYGDISYPNAGIGTMPNLVDMRQAGPQNIYFTYGGITTSNYFTITVAEPPVAVVTGITATTTRHNYYTGEHFDLNTFTVRAEFQIEGVAGSRILEQGDFTLTIGGIQFNAPHTFSAAANNIPVVFTYSGFTTEPVPINVTQLALASISIHQMPHKETYNFGDTLDLSGLVLSGVNNNGSSYGNIVWASTAGIGTNPHPVNMEHVGAQHIRFTYSGLTTAIDDFFKITVAPPPPVTVTFNSGEGSIVPDQIQEVPFNSQALALSVPHAEPFPFTERGLYEGGNYVFTGWFAPGANEPFNFSAPLRANITLTAQWESPQQLTGFAANFTVSAQGVNTAAAAATTNQNILNPILTHAANNPNDNFVLVVDSASATQVIFLEGNTYTRNVSGRLELRGIAGRPVQRFRLSSNGAMFNVTGANGALTLGRGITLEGRHASASLNNNTQPSSANNTHPVIRVINGGRLYMDTGSAIRINRPANGNSGANRGGGVHVANNGVFVMRGGSINNNGLSDGGNNRGGAVFIAEGGRFDMRGGELTGNRGSNAAIGPTIANVGGTFRISHGWIPGNERPEGESLRNDRNTTAGFINRSAAGVLHHSGDATSVWGTFDEAGNFTQAGAFATSNNEYNRDEGILVVNGQRVMERNELPATNRPAAFPAP